MNVNSFTSLNTSEVFFDFCYKFILSTWSYGTLAMWYGLGQQTDSLE